METAAFWKYVLTKDRKALQGFFREDAVIRWHCTNELFTVTEYLQASCGYPGDWDGEIERTEETGSTVITAVHVFTADKKSSFHVVSFIKLKEDLIAEMDEYWADDGQIPVWRKEMDIGRPIRIRSEQSWRNRS